MTRLSRLWDQFVFNLTNSFHFWPMVANFFLAFHERNEIHCVGLWFNFGSPSLHFVCTLFLPVANCMLLQNLMFNISFGCCRHSVSNTFVQLTEGRSARDQPKQPPAKKMWFNLESPSAWKVEVYQLMWLQKNERMADVTAIIGWDSTSTTRLISFSMEEDGI